MANTYISPQQKFLFGGNGSRIELDVDVHADIDYDFFVPGAKSLNQKPSSVDQKVGKPITSEIKKAEEVNVLGSAAVESGKDISKRIFGSIKTVDNNKQRSAIELAHMNDNVHKLDINKDDVLEVTSFKRQKYQNGNEMNGLLAGNSRKRNGECHISETIVIDAHTSLPAQKPIQLQKKNLMNCIAYSTNTICDMSTTESYLSKEKSQIEKDDSRSRIDSASSNTTSEITDVTSRATSSDDSLRGEDKTESRLKGNYEPQRPNSWERRTPVSFLVDSMNMLQIHNLRRDSKMSSSTVLSYSSIRSSGSRNLPARKNMTFTNDEMWRIERENQSLLSKIEGKRNVRAKPTLTPVNLSPSSSAINRIKAIRKIEQENQRLVKKLRSVKSVTDTSRPWRPGR